MSKTLIALKAQAGALITQLGLNMLHASHAQAAGYASDPEAYAKAGKLLATAHTNLQKAAATVDKATPKVATPVLASVGGDKRK